MIFVYSKKLKLVISLGLSGETIQFSIDEVFEALISFHPNYKKVAGHGVDDIGPNVLQCLHLL